MRPPIVPCLLLSIATAGLAACGQGEADEPLPERDPAVAQVLGGRLMVDPDLAGSNEANAALTARHNYGLPPVAFPRKTINGAREEAAELVDGQDKLEEVPEPENIGDAFPGIMRMSAAARANFLDVSEECVSNLEYSAVWAARLPEHLVPYPRGATSEAAGVRNTRCDVVTASYLAPVGGENILSFYQALATKNGYDIEILEQGEARILRGVGKGQRFAAFVAAHESEQARVDLVSIRAK